MYSIPVAVLDATGASSATDQPARATVVELATHALRAEIVGGTLRPGARVHLNNTAARLGVSPVPVREALRSLASEGLVVALPQRGYRVSPATDEDLDDTYRLRCILDPLAVEMAVPRLDSDRFADIDDAFDGLVAAYATDDWAAHALHHRRFHFGIYDACGSPWLLRSLNMLWDNSSRYQRLSTLRRGTLTQRTEEHRRIRSACRSGEADLASGLVREHLELTKRSVHDLFGGQEDS